VLLALLLDAVLEELPDDEEAPEDADTALEADAPPLPPPPSASCL